MVPFVLIEVAIQILVRCRVIQKDRHCQKCFV